MVSFGLLTCVPVSLGPFCFGHLCLVPLLAASSPVPLWACPVGVPSPGPIWISQCNGDPFASNSDKSKYLWGLWPQIDQGPRIGDQTVKHNLHGPDFCKEWWLWETELPVARSPLADKLKCWKRRGIFGALKDFAAVYEPVSTVEVCATLMKDWLGEKRWSMPW